jgi:peptidoglycan/xylan/chitin deacetylase (PgdA/CDA1 family)
VRIDLNEQGLLERLSLEVGGEPAGTVQAIHFHNTPPWREAEIAEQLRGCAPSGMWEVDGPPVAVFFEGYRNNHDLALPLLERFGVKAWFVIPTEFLDVPVEEQLAYSGPRDLGLVPDDGPRYAMTWDELRDVAARGHHIASHTASHCTIEELHAGLDFTHEITGSRRRLEAELGVSVEAVCLRHGTAYGDDAELDAAIREAGYTTVIAAGRVQTAIA